MAQHRRYPGSTIFAFDKDYSMYALCKGAGGTHYDIGNDDQDVSFCPLHNIDSDSDLNWRCEWIETLCELQKVTLTPKERKLIHQAMVDLRESPTRSLTEFIATIQSIEIREALEYYSITGSMNELLDSESDSLNEDSTFTVFEIKELMEKGEKAVIPVLTYVFHRIEKMLKGQPALLVIDEAWIALGHPAFKDKLREWLKVLRKANCSVILATQSLSDLGMSGIADVVVESCLTTILLPNTRAKEVAFEEIYKNYYGLNDAQISLIATARMKRDYYYLSDRGRRMFDLALGPRTLAFTGIAGVAGKQRVDDFILREGEDKWVSKWLEAHS